MANLLPFTKETIPDGIPDFFREGFDYYRTPRAQHPRATGLYPVRSADAMAGFDPFVIVDKISPRPLLMIAGSEADTRLFSEDGIRRAQEPKELFLVPGKTNIALYDPVEGHIDKLIDFMVASLTA
jgi:uncharacterized protein